MPGMNGATVTELIRRLEQVLRYGTIAAVDLAAARCRVRTGALVTTWVPWFAQRAGTTLHWSPPTVGEQCLLISPGGDTAGAVALVGLYSSAAPAPSSSASMHTTHYADGAVLTYDHASHSLSAVLPSVGSFAITATAGTINVDQLTVNADATTWNGPIQLNGHMDATGDVTAAGISLMGHKHPGIDRGNSLTDPPQ